MRPKRLKNHWGRSYPYSHIREYHPGLLMGCIFPLLAPPLSRFPALFTGHATRLLPIVFSSALASGYMFSALCKSLVFWRLPCMCFYVHVLRRVLTCLCWRCNKHGQRSILYVGVPGGDSGAIPCTSLAWLVFPPSHWGKYIFHTLSFHSAALTEYTYNFCEAGSYYWCRERGPPFSKYGWCARFCLDFWPLLVAGKVWSWASGFIIGKLSVY